MNFPNRNAVASVPNISFIPFHPMTPQKLANLILETPFVMMFILGHDISLDLLKIRLTHGKISIASLPLKVGKRIFLLSATGSKLASTLTPIRPE